MKGSWPLRIPWSPRLLHWDGMYQWALPPGRASFLQWLLVSYRGHSHETKKPIDLHLCPALPCSGTGLQVCSIPCSVPNKGSLGLENSPESYYTQLPAPLCMPGILLGTFQRLPEFRSVRSLTSPETGVQKTVLGALGAQMQTLWQRK